MRRTLSTAVLGLALLALAACQQGGQGNNSGGSRGTPDLAGAFTRTYGAKVANAFPAAQRAALSRCIGQSLANGIPLNDQILIFDHIDAGKKTAASQAAMTRWLGGPLVHGPVLNTGVSSSVGAGARPVYADGSAATPGSPAVVRIERNVQQFCATYKDRLMKAGYISGVRGEGGF
jgi:hypothetical protein